MLEAIMRESTAKQATKALRKDGYLIANIYAAGMENISCAFKKNEFIKYLRTKQTLAFDVKVGTKTHKVVVQEYQKHPVTSDFLHVDLRVVTGDKPQKFLIPVKTKGTPKGLKNKGVLVFMHKRIPVFCKPKDLFDDFTIDVSDLDVNDSVSIKDIETPKNVRMGLNPSVAVLGLIKAK